MPLPFATEQDVIRVVQQAERLGYHSAWGNDHITAPRYVREEFPDPPRFYEPLIALSYAAAVTQKIKLGTCVIVLPMREPVYLAKQVATLDQLSGGRVLFGVGVGAYREEFEAIHPDLKDAERGKMVDESIQALRLLFDEPRASFRGKYFAFEGIGLYPKPRQSPLPIYIGGNNLNAVRRAARWGQGWLPASQQIDDLRRGVQLLHREAEAAGRDPASLEVAPQVMVMMGRDEADVRRRFRCTPMYRHVNSLSSSTLRDQDLTQIEEYNLIGTRQQIIDKIAEFTAAGVTLLASTIFLNDTVDEMIESMHEFSEEVMPAFAS